MGAFTYPLYGNWAWGGGWLSNLGTNFGLGKGYCGLRRLGRGARRGRHHRAWRSAMIIGPRIGKYNARRQADHHARATTW